MTSPDRPITGASHSDLLSRLNRIDDLIRTVSEKAELPPIKEILDEWTEIVIKARKLIDT